MLRPPPPRGPGLRRLVGAGVLTVLLALPAGSFVVPAAAAVANEDVAAADPALVAPQPSQRISDRMLELTLDTPVDGVEVTLGGGVWSSDVAGTTFDLDLLVPASGSAPANGAHTLTVTAVVVDLEVALADVDVVVDLTPQAPAPAAKVRGDDVVVAWPPVPGAEGYRVQRRSASTAWATVADGPATEHRDVAPGPGDWRYQVQAWRAGAVAQRNLSVEGVAAATVAAPAPAPPQRPPPEKPVDTDDDPDPEPEPVPAKQPADSGRDKPRRSRPAPPPRTVASAGGITGRLAPSPLVPALPRLQAGNPSVAVTTVPDDARLTVPAPRAAAPPLAANQFASSEVPEPLVAPAAPQGALALDVSPPPVPDIPPIVPLLAVVGMSLVFTDVSMLRRRAGRT